MNEQKVKQLIEGAYAQTPTLPGFWLKYDEFRNRFNELVSSQGEEVVDIDSELPRLFPDVAFEEQYQLKGTDEIFRAIRLAPNKLSITKDLRKKFEIKYGSAAKDNEGWANFAAFGVDGLKEECREMGFDGLRHAVQCLFGKRFEFRVGDTSKHEAPVMVRDLKKVGQGQDVDDPRNDDKNYVPGRIPSACVSSPKQGSYIGDEIDKYAYFPRPKNIERGFGWDIAINELATNVALDERWYYHEKDRITKPILKNYLSYTFERLLYEDEQELILAEKENRKPHKKILENSNYSVWNTGLVDSIYDPIFAFFKRNNGSNPNVKQPWIFLAFGTANSYYQNIISDFPYRPERAEYFTNPTDLFFDCRAGEPTLNWKHFIKDNIERLPLGFIKKGATSGFVFEDLDEMSPVEKKSFYKKLAQAIFDDDDWLLMLTTRFRNALDISLSRVAWNYKTAIPVYYVEGKTMSLLLPLALENRGTIDVALVCEHKYNPEEGVNNYVGRTIFTLEMAYNNARLITRPDSDWLMADMGGRI